MNKFFLGLFLFILFCGCVSNREISEPLDIQTPNEPKESPLIKTENPKTLVVEPKEELEAEKETRDVFFANLSLKLVPTFMGVPSNEVNGAMEVRLKDVIIGKKAMVYYYVNLSKGEDVIEKNGVYEAISFADSREISAPWYWGNGRALTKTSLFWLSKEVFLELKTTGSTKLKHNFSGGTPDWYVDSMGEKEFFDLSADSDYVYYDLKIDGEMDLVRCIKAVDEFGSEYLILDNPDNPLIMKLSHMFVDDSVGLNKMLKNMAGYEITEVKIDYSPLDQEKFGV